MLYLATELQQAWQNPFASILSLEGQVYREQSGRRTLKFNYNGQEYFAKIHTGVGWREIFKNLLQWRLPTLSAKPEWSALQRLKSLNIATLSLVGYGCRGWNPACLQSFVITKALQDMVSLEDHTLDWQKQTPSVAEKRFLINSIAKIARCLHDNGINHRDFYLCHFLIPRNFAIDSSPIYLIDLHRAQQRRRLPLRWRIKDLSGLYFSALDIGLSQRDCWRFIRSYRDLPLHRIWREECALWHKVKHRALRLYVKHHGH